MTIEKNRVASGVSNLDQLLGGLYIGDNVVWYDDAGSLAYLFCMNFIKASQEQKKSLIYVSFDRSMKNLIGKLGPLADYPRLTILDCFTHGKGAGSDVFLEFYDKKNTNIACRIKQVKEPGNSHGVMDAFYGIHKKMKGDVRFVFESLTGMQELWGGEDHIVNFYAHSCPRLYDLNTIAYWIIEKRAHSVKLRAKINQIAQVAIDLSLKRGKTALNILKAENREIQGLNRPVTYWNKGADIAFESEKDVAGQSEFGLRLREIRTRQGLSQTELAKLIGVTPSTISQVESNLIYPSLPALFKMAEVLSVEVGSFFQATTQKGNRVLFHAADAIDNKFPEIKKGIISGKRLTPADFEADAEPYIVEIPPRKKLSSHFFSHKGDEMGYLLSGTLHLQFSGSQITAQPGDTIYLKSEIPDHWHNKGTETVRLLWIKVK